MAFFALSWAACSDGDDDTLAQRVEGTYVGNIDVTVLGTRESFTDKSVSIEATADNVITLSLKEFSFGAMNVGDIVIPGIKLTEKKEVIEQETYNYAEPEGTAKVTINLGVPTEVTVKVLPEDSFIDLEGNEGISLRIQVVDVKIGEVDVTIDVEFEGNPK